MKIYIWDDVENCSHNYHSDGGVVVLANSQKEARKLFKANSKSGAWYDDEDHYCEIGETELPTVFQLAGKITKDTQRVYVFPNAGCC